MAKKSKPTLTKEDPDRRGYYHTGANSYDSPEIREFGADGPLGRDDAHFAWGPFLAFQEAKRDLLDMVRADIERYVYLRSNVISLKRNRGP